MKKMPLVASPVVLLVLLGAPSRASAKAPTVKIIVSGGGLKSAVEITDTQLLALSNVWAGNFLDSARGLAEKAPKASETYEVSFYVKFRDEDVRKVYVVYYSPNPSTEQGTIYLPGRGETWYSLNAGTITRRQDGKWNYASRAWEDLIKPVIARPVARQHHNP